MSEKILIVRLSSFGDILQCMAVPAVLKTRFPQAEVHWVVRDDFAELLAHNPSVDRVWVFQRTEGLFGWLRMLAQLRGEKFTHVYDAHNNVRSGLLTWFFFLSYFHAPFRYLRRGKNRWKRFLLFRLGKNLFPKPFRGQYSFLEPLKTWGATIQVPREAQLFFSKDIREKIDGLQLPERFIALAPSAAWEMKRWPLSYWKELIRSMPQKNFVLLGGPDDRFCRDLANIAPDRCVNLAGRLKLLESCAVLERADGVVSADTGLLHAADLLGRKTVALIGPTAFGYPSHENSRVLEVDLPCKPCSKDGRGRCKQTVYQKCMIEIRPEMVSERL